MATPLLSYGGPSIDPAGIKPTFIALADIQSTFFGSPRQWMEIIPSAGRRHAAIQRRLVSAWRPSAK
jgi:hypothetical protein